MVSADRGTERYRLTLVEDPFTAGEDLDGVVLGVVPLESGLCCSPSRLSLVPA